ncbi:hypothetical protein WICPIJ_001276 [Wickerhamomyces pijperi]|uniref:Uncharacterized protein n=1 Tax=Wickerhamomyces pijperi TaxID=599730 RepID=A0A9P8QDW8_WICPI|nr:hypothetical protein WICPIJ_001276 [Wickerhamomyces pijperi]
MQSDTPISFEPDTSDFTEKPATVKLSRSIGDRPNSAAISSKIKSLNTKPTKSEVQSENSKSDNTPALNISFNDEAMNPEPVASITLPKDFSPGEPQRQKHPPSAKSPASATNQKQKQKRKPLNRPILLEELAGVGNIPLNKKKNRQGANTDVVVLNAPSDLPSPRSFDLLPPGFSALAAAAQRAHLESQNVSEDSDLPLEESLSLDLRDLYEEEEERQETLDNAQSLKLENESLIRTLTPEKSKDKRSKLLSKSLSTSRVENGTAPDQQKLAMSARSLSQQPTLYAKRNLSIKMSSHVQNSGANSSQLSTQPSSSILTNTSQSRMASAKVATGFSTTSLGTSTSYYTAKSSPSQITNSAQESPLLALPSSNNNYNTSVITRPTKEEDSDSLLENNDYDNLDSPDKDYNELDHKPPFLPSQQSYNGFGKPSLRQTVIQRQSARISPLSDPLVEHMEERLARWNGPQSSSSAADAINGRHPYQRQDIPILEPQLVQKDSPKTGETETNTSIESILRSAYVSNQLPLNCPQRQVTFREEVRTLDKNDRSGVQPLSPQSNNSIQDSLDFVYQPTDSTAHPQQIPDSASVSSSIMERINSISQHSSQTRERSASNLDVSDVVTERTPEALPLNSGDLRDLSKGGNRHVHNLNDNPFVLQRVEPDPISGFGAYDPRRTAALEEEGFWRQFGECCFFTITCGCLDADDMDDY